MKLRFEKLAPEDVLAFRELLRVFEQVFELHDAVPPPEAHLQRLLRRPDFLAFVARADAEIVGGLTAYVLPQYHSETPMVYLYDLAVLQTQQRQGIGTGLVAALSQFCAALGCREMFVQADRTDGHALRFYRSARPTSEADVVQFSYTLNRRAARD